MNFLVAVPPVVIIRGEVSGKEAQATREAGGCVDSFRDLSAEPATATRQLPVCSAHFSPELLNA